MAGATVSISDTDRGMLEMMKRLVETDLHVAAGVPASVGGDAKKPGRRQGAGAKPANMGPKRLLHQRRMKGKKKPLTLLEVAMVHEFGSKKAKIQRRSFIADTVDLKRARYDRLAKKVAGQVIVGAMTLDTGLNRMGLAMVGDMKKRISAGISPENADSTIARKGSSKPLINTGQLRNSLLHEVRHGR